MVQALPRKAHPAVGGGAQGTSLRDALNQLRLQRNGAVARFSRADTHQLLQQPVAHGAKGIVVKAVHAAFVKAAVGADAVPALPHGSCAAAHLIQPAGEILVQQQFSGKVIAADSGKCVHQNRRADKAGCQVPLMLVQILYKALGNAVAVLRPGKVKQKNQRQRGLSFAHHAPGCGDVLLLEAAADCAVQRGIFVCLLCFAQHGRRLGKQLGTMCVVGAGNQVGIGAATVAAALLAVKGQPVAVLKAALPQMVGRFLTAHRFYPRFHAGVLPFQNIPFAVKLVERPRNGDGGVTPDGSAAAALSVHVRHDVRHTAVRGLSNGKVGQPLAEKAVDVLILRGGAAENSSVTGPAQPFIALRAVGRHIDKVGALAPHDVRPQAVDQRGGAGKLRGGGSVRTQHQRGEGVKRRVAAHACNRDIAEAVVGEAGDKRILAAAAHKGIGGLGGAQVGSIQAAVRRQGFGKTQGDFLPGGTLPVQPDNTGHILAEIQNRRAVRRMQQLHRGAALEHAHRLALLGNQRRGMGVQIFCKDNRLRCSWHSGAVDALTVVELRLAVLPKVPLPARIGGNRDAVAVHAGERKLGKDGRLLAVHLPRSVQITGIPAVCGGDFQRVFQLNQRRDVIHLILQAACVLGPAGSKPVLRDLLPVQPHGIDAAGGKIQPCLLHRLGRKMSHKNRTFAVIFRQGVGNPLRGEKARRKQCRGKFSLALRGLAVVIPDSQLQCVAAFLVQRRARIADSGALAACDAPAVPKGHQAVPDTNPVSGLVYVLAVTFELPAQIRRRLTQCGRVLLPVNQNFGNLQHSFPPVYSPAHAASSACSTSGGRA